MNGVGGGVGGGVWMGWGWSGGKGNGTAGRWSTLSVGDAGGSVQVTGSDCLEGCVGNF